MFSPPSRFSTSRKLLSTSQVPPVPPVLLSVDSDPDARNPAVEEQAIDRIHRLGQLNEVSVKRFVVSGTVEDKMLALQVSFFSVVHLDVSVAFLLTVQIARVGE